METWSGDMAANSLNDFLCGQLHAWSFYPQAKSLWYSMNRMGRPQSFCEWEQKSICPYQDSLRHPPFSLITVQSGLSWVIIIIKEVRTYKHQQGTMQTCP